MLADLNQHRRILVCVLTMLSASALSPHDANADEPQVDSFALLIGINDYPQLSQARQLRGCINDVRFVQRILETYAHFPTASITTLTNADATRERILMQLNVIKQQVAASNAAGKSARVVLHFSGHGAQVLDQMSGPMRDEPTFFDQTLVPYDADRTGGESDIRDDTLRQWAAEICQVKDNRLFVALDCCHSGTGLRAMTRYRRLDRPLPQPDASKFAAIASPAELPPNAAVISACRSDQMEPEFQSGGQSHGLLTFWLCRLAQDSSQRSTIPLQTLPEVLRWKYLNESNVLIAPDPQLETSGNMAFGGLLFVAPNQTPAQACLIKVDRSGESTLMRGRLDGIEQGRSYTVYSGSELSQSAAVGEFVPSEVGATVSIGKTLFSSNQNRSNQYFCRVDKSPQALTVAISVSAATQLPSDLRCDFVSFQNTRLDADYELKITADQVHLSPVAGDQDENATDTPAIVTLPRDSSLRRRFAKLIRQIVAIKKLQALVADGVSQRLATSRQTPTQFSPQLHKGGIVNGAFLFTPAKSGEQGVPVLQTGDVYQLNIKHSAATNRDVYVTIVHIAPRLDVTMMCPQTFSQSDRSEQLISMPDGLTTRAFICNGDSRRDRDDPDFREPISGVHRAIVIASPTPADLSSVLGFIEGEFTRGKSLSPNTTKTIDSITIDFDNAARGKSLTSRSLKKSSDAWWDATMIQWFSK